MKVDPAPAWAVAHYGLVETGRLDPLTPRGFSGFVHRPDELRAEVAEAGLRETALVLVEGAGAYLLYLEERWASPA